MVRQRLADLDRLARLPAGARGDVGRDLDFGTRVLDRADQPRRGLRGFAHRDRRLLGGGGDFAGLAQHAARRRGSGAGLGAELVALAGAILDDAEHLLVEGGGLAPVDGFALGAGDRNGVMDEGVDLDRLEVGQGAREGDLLGIVG